MICLATVSFVSTKAVNNPTGVTNYTQAIKRLQSADKKDDKPNMKGSCPKASLFGLEDDKVRETSEPPICGGLKTTCCSRKSMESFKDNWNQWVSKTSKDLWAVSRLPTLLGLLLANAGNTDNCSSDKKDKKDESSDKKDDSSDKKDDKKKSAERVLQAVKAKVKADAKADAKADTGSDAEGDANADAKADAKVDAKVSVSAEGSASANAYGNNKWDNSGSPKDWLKDTKCSKSFKAAYNAVMKANFVRDNFKNQAKNCLKGLAGFKSHIVCATCDNNNESKFSDVDTYGWNLKTESYEQLVPCLNFFLFTQQAVHALDLTLTYVEEISGEDRSQAHKDLQSYLPNNFLAKCKKESSRRLQSVSKPIFSNDDLSVDSKGQLQVKKVYKEGDNKSQLDDEWSGYVEMKQAKKNDDYGFAYSKACVAMSGILHKFIDHYLYLDVSQDDGVVTQFAEIWKAMSVAYDFGANASAKVA